MFNGILIINNIIKNLVPILNYKLLCYILFYISGMMTRYKIWQSDEEDTKKINPITQKTIIVSFVDFINSLVEIFYLNPTSILYQIVLNKFFIKLNTTFSEESILLKIKNLESKKQVMLQNRTKSEKYIIPLDGQYEKTNYTSKFIK